MKGSVVYSCACCRTPVATHDQLVSKSFHGRHGRAFLFASATNVTLGAKEERVLLTGLHSVADSFCAECTSRIGWKYLEAFESRYVRAHTPLYCAAIQLNVRWVPLNVRPQSKVQGGQIYRREVACG